MNTSIQSDLLKSDYVPPLFDTPQRLPFHVKEKQTIFSHLAWRQSGINKSCPPKLDKTVKNSHCSLVQTDQRHSTNWEAFLNEHYQTSGKNSMNLWHFCPCMLLCLKATRGIRFTTDFSSEMMETKGSRMTYLKCWNKTHCQARILSLANIKNEGEINAFSDKQRLKEFVASRPALREILKEVFWAEIDARQWLEFTRRNEEYRKW